MNEQIFALKWFRFYQRKAAREGQKHIYQEGRCMIYQEVTITGTR